MGCRVLALMGGEPRQLPLIGLLGALALLSGLALRAARVVG
jgi:hypothetical protein